MYEYGPFRVLASATSCLFCDYCSHVFWDFTHGGCSVACEADADTKAGRKGACKRFQTQEATAEQDAINAWNRRAGDAE